MTLREARALTKALANSLRLQAPGFLLLAAKDMEGRMKKRIFNEGKNSSGAKIGKYTSKWWKKQREEGGKFSKGGRQIAYVDLENTGDLRNSIIVAKDGQDAVIAINSAENYDKAMGQELIQGKKKGADRMPIFEPTKAEERAVQNYIDDLIDEEVEKILR